MCLAVFLGSDIEVPTFKEDRRFHIQDVGVEAIAVKPHFSKRHIYYLGSHEGCGCGFEWDARKDLEELGLYTKEWVGQSEEVKKTINWTPAEERQEYEARKRTAENLASFLKGLLQKTDHLEMGVFKDPEWGKGLTSKRFVTPDQLAQGCPDVFPIQGVLYIISKTAQQDAAPDAASAGPRR